jgi:hypothetical protein
MQLLVDGLDLGLRRGVGRLQGGISADDTDVSLDTTDGFPSRGAVQIGTEIIEYDTLGSGGLRDCVRGARESAPGDWPAGTPVRQLGYSMPVLTDIRKGGAHMRDGVGRFSAVRVWGKKDGQEQFQDRRLVTINEIEIELGGYETTSTNITFQATPMWGQTPEEALAAFNEEGVAILGSERPNSTAAGLADVGGWELVKYRRDGASFSVERYFETPHQQAAQPYFLLTHIVTFQRDVACFLVPVSVLMQSGGAAPGEDYFDPSLAEDVERLQRYGGDGMARVMVATDTPADALEVITYDSLDRKSFASIALLRSKNADIVANRLFGTSVNPAWT